MSSGCIPSSIVGKLDPKVIQTVEKLAVSDDPNMRLDPVYVRYQFDNHGGIPYKQWFKARNGNVFKIGRFVNYGGRYTGPYQASEMNPDLDFRTEWSVFNLETIGNIVEGCGMFLRPFGILYEREEHPDGSDAIYSNLVCFDYKRMNGKLPTVVAWINKKAFYEHCAIEERGGNPFYEMDHEKISYPVADCFAEFLELLELDEPKFSC